MKYNVKLVKDVVVFGIVGCLYAYACYTSFTTVMVTNVPALVYMYFKLK